MPDISQALAGQVRDAFEKKTPLCIRGTKSKSFLSHPVEGKTLSTLAHTGIVTHEPTELVATVRAGTPITSLQSSLARQNQSLAFDPPRYRQAGSIGGCVATGLSGPARPWAGAIRDHVLGARIINGRGDVLNFGGQVMKNVAGYDVSRLMTGAYGTLGLLLDISFKVLPLPEQCASLLFECDANTAIERANTWSGLPLSGACWLNNKLIIRLSGTQAGVDTAIKNTGGDLQAGGEQIWADLRDHQHSFFKDGSYWRLSLPPAAPMLPLAGEWFIDWGGAQRWLKTPEPGDKVRRAAAAAGGHAEQWHDADKSFLRMPLSRAAGHYHQKLKDAFDPERILNKGAFYPTL